MAGRMTTKKTFAELKQDKLRSSVEREIRRIIDFRLAHKIVPARAPWRELRDVLNEEEMGKLQQLVELGAVKEYRGIHYPSYEIDYEVFRRLG